MDTSYSWEDSSWTQEGNTSHQEQSAIAVFPQGSDGFPNTGHLEDLARQGAGPAGLYHVFAKKPGLADP